MIAGIKNITVNASLENYNTYGIKTSTKYLIKPESINDLLNILNILNDQHIKYLVLGKGSNVILPDNAFKGAIISLELLNHINIKETEVYAEAGVILNKLIRDTINNGLQGLENLANIPGTLGGALHGNAGANGSEIYDYLKEITVIRNNKVINIPKDNIKYNYRYTEFCNNKDIIVGASFILKNGNKEEMLDIININRQKRLNSQPLEYKNAGSVFKNPIGYYAGKLIEDAGLKGAKVNDAEVSTKHANFIINKGNASSKDIRNLIAIIKEKVYNTYKIELEAEQQIIEWDENEEDEKKKIKN